MAPILIDSRELLKLGFISVLVTFMVFAIGFFCGYQQAATYLTAGSKTESLLLPEKVAAIESQIEAQVPEIIEAGETVDVDQPRTLPETVAAIEVEVIEPVTMIKASLEESGNKEIIGHSKTKQSIDDDVPVKNSVLAETTATVIKKDTQKQHRLVAAAVQQVKAEKTAAELEKIKYSVQVGVYGRLINAENMMRMLQAQQWDAYVSDYTNKKEEVRYNVRIGYYTDKKTAMAALTEYKKIQKGEAYLVRLSVENMADLANAKNIEKAATIENMAPKKSPDAMPPRDEEIQENLITTSNVISRVQAKGPVAN